MGLDFHGAVNALPFSRQAFRPDMQNWNIAVTTFSKTPLLDTIRTPDDLRKLKVEQVRQVADELRLETIDAVSVTGGHFGAGLGVVELTTAIHYTFDTPRDRLIWDVGHQAYPHKILTGLRGRSRVVGRLRVVLDQQLDRLRVEIAGDPAGEREAHVDP